jgi:hypothetical protein
MALNIMHYNYLFVGNKRCDLTLLNAAVYPEIMDAVAPVLRHTNIKKGRISTIQYANRKPVKAGWLRWDLDSPGVQPGLEQKEGGGVRGWRGIGVYFLRNRAHQRCTSGLGSGETSPLGVVWRRCKRGGGDLQSMIKR